MANQIIVINTPSDQPAPSRQIPAPQQHSLPPAHVDTDSSVGTFQIPRDPVPLWQQVQRTVLIAIAIIIGFLLLRALLVKPQQQTGSQGLSGREMQLLLENQQQQQQIQQLNQQLQMQYEYQKGYSSGANVD